ncbi:MAG: hypothetical protein WA435_05240 [Gallionellaceae bacterium]
MKPALQKLKHLLLAPFVWLAAAIFLVEETIWDWTAALMARLGAVRAIHAIERHIASLRPRWAFFAFLLPSVTIIPAKVFGFLAISSGHWLLGSVIFLIAKVVGVALFSRIFNLTRPALIQLDWFAHFYAWVMHYRNRIHDYLDHWQTYQRIKQRLHSMVAAFRAKLAALFSEAGK